MMNFFSFDVILKALLTYKVYALPATIGLVGLVLLLLLVMYILSIVFNKTIDIKAGPIKVFFKGGKKNGAKKLEKIENLLNLMDFKNEHCSLIQTIVNITRDKIEEKDQIKLKETIIRQMSAAEDVIIKIKSLMTNNYYEILRQKITDEDRGSVKMHRDYRYFQVMITSILDEIKRKSIKQSLEKNRILDFDDREWEEFIDNKANIIMTIISEYLDLMYQYNSLVSREELNNASRDVEHEIKAEIKDLYRDLKEIILEDEEKMDNIEKELKADINKTAEEFNCPTDKINSMLKEGDDKE